MTAKLLSVVRPGRILGAAVVVLATAATCLAQANTDDWRKGVALFEQGQYSEALDQLDSFLAANPSSEQAKRARDEAGYQVYVQMLARNDDIATIARKVLELALIADRFDQPDPSRIKALIKTMLSGEYEESYRAVNELASQIGPYCVPYVVEHLADRRNNDRRVKAIVLLSRLGLDGTNAVIELLYHPDDFVRQNACAILGHIRDLKGIPYLKSVTERSSESSHVKAAARDALKTITGSVPSESANVYFEALAERYYQEHPSITINNFKQWTIWDWREDKLTFRTVPSYAWNDEMAENVCYDALAHAQAIQTSAEKLDAIYTLLVSTFFNQVVEVKTMLEVADAKAAAGQIDSEDYESLQRADTRLATLRSLGAAKGEAQIAKALRKALIDRRVPLAVSLIEQLRDMRMSEELLPAPGAQLAGYLDSSETAPPSGLAVERRRLTPDSSSRSGALGGAKAAPPETDSESEESAPSKDSPSEKAPPRRRRRISGMDALDSSRLAQHQDLEAFPPQVVRTLQSSGAAHGAALAAALEYDDKRVRYAAAEALVRLAPTRPFANSDKVAENLAGALRESSSRVIIVAARDQQVRNRLSAIVRDLNHLPFAVPTAKQGLLRARSAPTQDAIIVHTRFRDDDFNTSRFLEEIERDYRTKGIPIIVVAPPDQVDKKRRQFTQAAAVLPDDVDPIVLKDQLEALWSGDNGRPNDPKRKAIALARQAALAVAESDPRSSVFALEATAPALLEAVERQPDEVRIPALRALGILGSTQAIAKVAVAFDNQLNHREVRIAAAFCLGEALRGKALPSKIFESFVQAMQSEDLGLFRSCGEALGKMRLSRDQALELFPTLRVE